MNFLTSPPEINSYSMYSGAGSTPMLAAATAWDGLAGELDSAAQAFSSVTSGLAGQAWQGPASAAMMATAARYTDILTAASAQAQTAAVQAQAVAGEFEAALAAIVHPALVSTNRNELVQLVMSNLFGQNAPAIAATEAEYEQMWAKDVAAMVGYHGGVSAAAAQLPSLQTVVQGLSAQVSGTVAASPVGSAISSATAAASSGPLGGLLGGVGQNVNAAVGQVRQDIIGAINTPTEMLLGRPLIGTGTGGSVGSAATTSATTGTATISTDGNSATAPLTVFGGTEPLVNASVGSGGSVPLLVDTGSTGLVIPYQDVGGIFGLLNYGLPTGFGASGYSGGLNYVYATYNMPVNFGGGVVTGSTPVNVELFAWPTTLQGLQDYGFSFQNFFASDGAVGVLGVGPNAGGPGTSIPTQHFANSSWDQGLLIDQPAHELVFGPQTVASQYGTGVALSGSPVTNLQVSVGGNDPITVPSIVDSGGVYGTFPTSVLGNPPASGTLIEVSSASGQPLYSYTYGGGANAYYPTAISSGLMNTGNLPFSEFPTYINYGADTTTIYTSA